MTRRKLNEQNILTMNKEVMLFFIGDSKGENILPRTNFTQKYLTVNFFQTTVIIFAVDAISSNLSDFTMHLHITGPGVKPAEQRTLEYLEEVAVATAQ